MSKNVNFFEGITSKRLRFMVALADPTDVRTQNEIAAELDVAPETLSRWKKEKDFWETLWALTLHQLEPELHEVLKILIGRSKAGDLPSMKLLFEIAGKIGTQRKCTKFHYDLSCLDERLSTEEIKEMMTTTPQCITKRLLKFWDEIYGTMIDDLTPVSDQVFVAEDVEVAVA